MCSLREAIKSKTNAVCSPTYSLWAICNAPGRLFWPTTRALPLLFLTAPHRSAQSCVCLLTQLATRSLLLPRSLFSVKMMFSIPCPSVYLRVSLSVTAFETDFAFQRIFVFLVFYVYKIWWVIYSLHIFFTRGCAPGKKLKCKLQCVTAT